MTWNSTPTPAGWVSDITSARHAHLFLLGDDLTFTLSASTAESYEVRDYYGEVVASGLCSGTSLTVPALPLGWFKLYLHRSTVDPAYGTLIGMRTFAVLRPSVNLLDPPGPTSPVGNTPQSPDHLVRGIAGLGPHRNQISDAVNYTGTDGYRLGGVQTDLALQDQWWREAHVDPIRPRANFLLWPNGNTNVPQVSEVVQALYPDIEYFEGPRNEPQGTAAGTVAADMEAFYGRVKAGHPDARVLGPVPVSVNAGTIGWIDAFADAGGLDWVDALAVHVYNCINGDHVLGRRVFDRLIDVLTAHGHENIEKWQTEWGTFATTYGVFDHRRQARWAMMHRLVLDEYDIPKERDYWFYDKSHGFWDFPSFWKLPNGSITSMIPLYRVFSDELFGKSYAGRYTFGDPWDDIYIGNRYEAADGSSVAVFMSNGCFDRTVPMRLTGATTVTLVNPWGTTSTLSAAAGEIDVLVTDVPVYVRLPEGVTLTPVLPEMSANIPRQRYTTAIVPSSPTQHRRLINNTRENWYDQGGAAHGYEASADVPSNLDLVWDNPVRLDTVILDCGQPWQSIGAPLDFDLQVLDIDGLTWSIVDTFVASPIVIPARSPSSDGNCLVDTYWDAQSVFIHEFEPVTTTAIRFVFRDWSYGGHATALEKEAGGQGGNPRVTIREIGVYSREAKRRRLVVAV